MRGLVSWSLAFIHLYVSRKARRSIRQVRGTRTPKGGWGEWGRGSEMQKYNSEISLLRKSLEETKKTDLGFFLRFLSFKHIDPIHPFFGTEVKKNHWARIVRWAINYGQKYGGKGGTKTALNCATNFGRRPSAGSNFWVRPLKNDFSLYRRMDKDQKTDHKKDKEQMDGWFVALSRREPKKHLNPPIKIGHNLKSWTI